MTTTRRRVVAVVAAATLALTGCGGEDGTSADPTPTATVTPAATATESPSESPSGQPEPTRSTPTATVSVDVEISGDSVTPVAEQVELGVGEVLEMRIDSDRVGELHVHSSPEQLFEFQPGQRTVEITIEKPGQVDIEEHESGVLLVRALVE